MRLPDSPPPDRVCVIVHDTSDSALRGQLGWGLRPCTRYHRQRGCQASKTGRVPKGWGWGFRPHRASVQLHFDLRGVPRNIPEASQKAVCIRLRLALRSRWGASGAAPNQSAHYGSNNH